MIAVDGNGFFAQYRQKRRRLNNSTQENYNSKQRKSEMKPRIHKSQFIGKNLLSGYESKFKNLQDRVSMQHQLNASFQASTLEKAKYPLGGAHYDSLDQDGFSKT